MNYPKISIITPSHNSEGYIEKCINSVLSQTYKNIEYIIVDGMSKDRTLDIIKKYGSKLVWISEKDNGNYDAIKKGFTKATGDVVTWLDSDNYYYQNDVLEKIAECFNKIEPEIVITNCYSHYEESEKMHLVNPPEREISAYSLINSGNIFMPECAFYKKSLYDKSGGLNLKYKLLADYELWIKILKLKPKLQRLQIISSVYETRANALLRQNFLKSWKESFMVGEEHHRDFLSKIKFYLLYIKARMRYIATSLVNKNKKLRKFIIKTFY